MAKKKSKAAKKKVAKKRSYTDYKGRTRWVVNDEIAEKFKSVHDLLVIGGYDETFAKRYPKIAHTISRWPDPLDKMAAADQLGGIPGVGGVIAEMITQFLDTGTFDKWEDFAKDTPVSVLEMTQIPGLGAKTAKMLYQEYHISNLKSLGKKLKAGDLDGAPGIGPKTRKTIQEFIANQ